MRTEVFCGCVVSRCLAVVAAVGSVAACLATAAGQPKSSCDPALLAADQREHLYDESMRRMNQERAERIKHAMERLKAARKMGEAGDWCFAQAATELGVMRAWEAAQLLAEHIAYRPDRFLPACVDSAGHAPPLSFYPAADALRQIGPIARDTVIAHILSKRRRPSEEEVRICCWVLLMSQADFNRCFGLDYDVQDYTKKSVLAWIDTYKTRGCDTTSLERLAMASNIVRGYNQVQGEPFDHLFWFPPIYELPHARVGRSYRFALEIRPPRIRPYYPAKKWTPGTRLLEDPTELEYQFGFPAKLPKGLRVTEDGVIVGTPRESGRFRFVLQAGQKTGRAYLDHWTQQEFLLIVHAESACDKCEK